MVWGFFFFEYVPMRIMVNFRFSSKADYIKKVQILYREQYNGIINVFVNSKYTLHNVLYGYVLWTKNVCINNEYT